MVLHHASAELAGRCIAARLVPLLVCLGLALAMFTAGANASAAAQSGVVAMPALHPDVRDPSCPVVTAPEPQSEDDDASATPVPSSDAPPLRSDLVDPPRSRTADARGTSATTGLGRGPPSRLG